MADKKYASLNSLTNLVNNIKNKYALIGHKHTKSDITDFPDISTYSDATESESGLMSASDKIQVNNGGVAIVTTSGTGAEYTATVNNISELRTGMQITIIPHANSTTTSPTLNVNNLGAKTLRMPIAYNSSATSAGAIESWIVANKPITLEYDGIYWRTVSLPRPSAQYLYGAVPIENGGTGATDANTALSNLGASPRLPLGSLYKTTSDANPSTLLGYGTWEKVDALSYPESYYYEDLVIRTSGWTASSTTCSFSFPLNNASKYTSIRLNSLTLFRMFANGNRYYYSGIAENVPPVDMWTCKIEGDNVLVEISVDSGGAWKTTSGASLGGNQCVGIYAILKASLTGGLGITTWKRVPEPVTE